MESQKKRIGELLIDAGVVTESVIQEALRNKSAGQRIGDYLVGRGSVSEDVLYEKLGEQLRMSVYRLSDIEVKIELLNDERIPRDVLRRGCAFPVELAGSLLTIALSDPLDELAIAEITKAVDYEVNFVLATKSEVLDYIGKYYDLDDSITSLFSELVGSDTDDLHVADKLVDLVNGGDKFSIVIRDYSGSLEAVKGSFGTTHRDLRDLLKFAINSTGMPKDAPSGVYDVVVPFDESTKLVVRIVFSVVGKCKEYWIEFSKLYPEVVEGGNLFDDVNDPGVYVLLDKEFSNMATYQQGVIGINNRDKFKDRVIVVGDDLLYESNGVSTLSNRVEISNYHYFADVFVFDKGWELVNINAIFSLLREQKIVILHLPFRNEDDLKSYLGGSFEGSSLLKLVNRVMYC